MQRVIALALLGFAKGLLQERQPENGLSNWLAGAYQSIFYGSTDQSLGQALVATAIELMAVRANQEPLHYSISLAKTLKHKAANAAFGHKAAKAAFGLICLEQVVRGIAAPHCCCVKSLRLSWA